MINVYIATEVVSVFVSRSLYFVKLHVRTKKVSVAVSHLRSLSSGALIYGLVGLLKFNGKLGLLA